MPTTITGANSFPASFQIPVGGDPRNAASVDAPFQALADRTAYLKTILESTGIKLVRSVASLAALQALTGMAENELAVVADASSVWGIYVFKGASTATPDSPYIIQPSVGGGRWHHQLLQGITAGGVSGTEDRWGAIQVPNAVAGMIDKSASNTVTTSATGGWDDSGFASDSTLLKQGDMVKIECVATANTTSASGGMSARLAVYNGASTNALANADVNVAVGASANVILPLLGYYTVPATGAYTFKLQLQTSNGASNILNSGRRIIVTVVRP